ncbi:MAG: T9SS type A sorting domain-containing protein, partial [Candidatus Marinimicrobia bacterium]|nr:T9SS type A sorting domain-containing protein [Candidatus Neomarinimicrobiota bacterium]
EKQILIVDGFDRFSGTGSYTSSTHAIAAQTAKAMNTWGVAYESCTNETVINGDVDLKDYDMVWWILGDESTADETFDSIEQDSIISYLKQGGKLFVSGSEIAWDLDYKGTTADKAFIHNYLKTVYAADDAGNYMVSGATGSIFENLNFQYSDDGSEPETYAEDYPDVFSTTGGSILALKYGNSQTAAVSFEGTVPEGDTPCKVMVMGFPFETISTLISKETLAGYILRFMGYNVSVDINTILPEEYILYQNYPNPFNPRTTIAYTLNTSAYVELTVFNIRGEQIRNLVQEYQSSGRYEVNFNGTSLPSGVYVYRLNINHDPVKVKKMILSK